MGHIMKGNMRKEKNMEKGNWFLQMGLFMKANLITMIFMGEVSHNIMINK
jgi:hypothetical protein